MTELDVEALDVVAAAAANTTSRLRARVPGLTRLDFWLDLVLLLAFTLDYAFRFTGLSIHEWIGIGFAVALIAHLTLHWDWVLKTTGGLLGGVEVAAETPEVRRGAVVERIDAQILD